MRLRRKRGFPTPARWRTVFDTLLGEILLWLVIILMLAWSIGVAMIYNVTGKFANEPYDVALGNNVEALSRLVGFEAGRISINLPGPARDLLRSDNDDKIYFQISNERGDLLLGDAEVPWVAKEPGQRLGKVYWRDEEVGDDEVRVAYLFKQVAKDRPEVLVQVAETRNKRNGMAARIVSSVIVPQFAIVPLAVLMIYFAVSRGVTPLHRLQEDLRNRRPQDLSAVSIERIPAEIRPLIEAFNDTMGRLDESLTSQRRFIADAAHQLKTPLAGLRAQAELAATEHSPAALHACLAQMLKAIERLSGMTQKLLTLARTDALHDQSLVFEPVDLNELVPNVARDLGMNALPKGVSLSFDNEAQPALVLGNSGLLYELFANLIDNAIRYTPAGGAICLHVRREADRLVVAVDDTGVGIPAEMRERVFERFFRVLGTQVDGSGLGLAIVKEIAELHAASIAINEGSTGRGTCVRVRFSAVSQP